MGLLWRISNRCDLEGVGGEKANGRWHTAARGKRVVYLSEHPAVALVEVLANLHTNPKLFPGTYQLIKVMAPEDLPREVLARDRLPEGWPNQVAVTRSIGDEWLAQRSTALLIVPSVPSPESLNCLLNPLHPDARKIKIEWCKWIEYDSRFSLKPAPQN
jgi:RES domain-containing protein